MSVLIPDEVLEAAHMSEEEFQREVALLEKKLETLLREIPIPEDLKNLVDWLASDPGRNLRNKVGHGYIQLEECDPRGGGDRHCIPQSVFQARAARRSWSPVFAAWADKR